MMEVQLYVYDLSRGMARQFSSMFLGTQIDAVYHTSIVVGGIEYFFGAGIQQTVPGMTHHGRPMEIIPMGETQLDSETIQDYLQSLKELYTPESYDLFLNNCNNFTNDLSQFLVGNGIPDHITSLPQTVLNTPFGQMLKPQLDRAMRGITQAPVPAIPGSLVAPSGASELSLSNSISSSKTGKVHEVTSIEHLDSLLATSADSCATIFFTSQSCPPCRLCYPVYNQLAEDLGSLVTLIKVDISRAFNIGSRYQVRATPTFISFLRGDVFEEWKGANTAILEQKIRLLARMAHPPHPHSEMSLPTLQKRYEKPILYTKTPPFEKLLVHLGDASSDPAIISMIEFLRYRSLPENTTVAPVPNLKEISSSIRKWLPLIPPNKLFALVDLLRLASADQRVSRHLAQEDTSHSVVLKILEHITGDAEFPYSTHLTTVQAICNLFTSNEFPPKLLGEDVFAEPLVSLIAISLLDESHAALRVSAASLAFNVASLIHRQRQDRLPESLKESLQIELVASLLEAISREQVEDALKGLLLALGLFSYEAPQHGELRGVLTALDAGQILAKKIVREDLELVQEVKSVLR